MADLILACARPGRPAVAAGSLRRAALRLAPPDVPLREPRLLQSIGVVVAVANPTAEGVFLHGHADERGEASRGGACVGGLFGPPGSWWNVGGEPPDGTYALARWDADTVELLSDVCASRTLWYALTDDAFLASTSQRALVMLLGRFELELEAVSCFLSSGTLGPTVAWDDRVRRLLPDARITLDRAAWHVSERHSPFVLTPAAGGDDAHISRLRDALETTCATLDLDQERWVLALSGGRDSRALLVTLAASGVHPRCITWTTRTSRRHPLSDASVAARLARRFGAEHELWYLDEHRVDLGTMLDRFVAANEGRNDEIAGYVDGLALWTHLAQAGVSGVLRGDEAYGPRRRPPAPEDGRRGLGGATADDYPAGHVIRRLDLAPQTWPAHLRISPGESRLDYRLRTMQTGYIPNAAAGLNGMKARYVEIATPHLSRLIIETVRSLPAELRRYSRAFSRIADDHARSIPHARSSSTPPMADLLRSPKMLEAIVSELASPGIERVLPGDGALVLLTALVAPGDGRARPKDVLKSTAKSILTALPPGVAYRLMPAWKGPEALSTARLGLRALLASRTVRLLDEDAGALRRDGESVADHG